MARIAGVDLQDTWKIEYALTRIKGIGWALAKKIIGETQIDRSKRVASLKDEEILAITAKVEEHPTEGELARRARANINRLREIGAYRGVRHSRGLPVRGQRTRSNARAKRGKRKTVGAFKKELLSKQQPRTTETKS